VLASRVREVMSAARNKQRLVEPSDGFNTSTQRMINKYLEGKTQLNYPRPRDVFPAQLVEAAEKF